MPTTNLLQLGLRTVINNTYAEVAVRQISRTKINQGMVTPKDTPPNHELLANIDDGFEGVERRRNRVKGSS